MKKLISIFAVFAIFMVSILLTSATNVKNDLNAEMNAPAPDHTQLKVHCDKDYYVINVKMYMISDYESQFGNITYGWVYPDTDEDDDSYYDIGWKAEFRSYTYAKVEWKEDSEDDWVTSYIYMDATNCTPPGMSQGDFVYQFTVDMEECVPPPKPE